MPSSPIGQTCSNTVGPSPVRCWVNWMERRLALPSSRASRRLPPSAAGRACRRRRARSGRTRIAPLHVPGACSVAHGSPAFRRRGRSRPRPSIRNDDAWMRLAASNDRRETISPIMAVASEAADPLAIPAHHQPIAVMLDFVDPQRAGRWPRHPRRQARFHKSG